MSRKRIPIEERLWSHVDKNGPNGCWVWTGARRGNGYGQLPIYVNGKQKNQSAHRISWELANGPIPAGMWVLHRCDNPACVRPDHLFVGSAADNSADCVLKGRNRSSLTVAQVIEAKEMLARGERDYKVARHFGVDAQIISAMKRNRSRRLIGPDLSGLPRRTTYQIIGDLLGVTRQRVHQLYRQSRLDWQIEGDQLVVLRDGERVAAGQIGQD